MDINELKQQRDEYVTRIFWLGLQIALIFGIPAILGAYLGMYLDSRFGTGRKITSFVLVIVFVLSWVIVLKKYQKMNNKIKAINREIKEKEILNNKEN